MRDDETEIYAYSYSYSYFDPLRGSGVRGKFDIGPLFLELEFRQPDQGGLRVVSELQIR